MKKHICLILSLILVVAVYFNAKALTKSIVCATSIDTAKAVCVLEKDSGRVLINNNMDTRLPMASTTKVVTAITVIDNCKNLDEIITIDKESVGIEGTSIYLRENEEIKVIDLLYGLMLRSGNDSATALARHISGDIDKFALLMKETALKVGATNSNFANPHGLDNPEHYTTAYDLALITAYALNNPTFKQIVSTKSYVIPATNKSNKRYLINKNKLLSSLDGCCGVKTGFTSKAGRCLVSAIDRNDTTYVSVVLNCGPMFELSREILNRVDDEYTNVKILDKNREIYNEYCLDDNNGRLYLYTDEDFYYPLLEGEKDNLILKYKVNLDNAKIGDEVGEIEIFLDKHLIKTAKLFTMNKIDKLIDSNLLSTSEILWEERIDEN